MTKDQQVISIGRSHHRKNRQIALANWFQNFMSRHRPVGDGRRRHKNSQHYRPHWKPAKNNVEAHGVRPFPLPVPLISRKTGCLRQRLPLAPDIARTQEPDFLAIGG
jgi:hypothetical protein